MPKGKIGQHTGKAPKDHVGLLTHLRSLPRTYRQKQWIRWVQKHLREEKK